MKCVIPGRNVKLFGRSIHCLSRIGDELFFEALQDGLALRTVNSSRSAYAGFVFSKTFLGEYEQGVDQIDCSNPADLLKCKITMKSCLSIFKSLATLEKSVDECKIIFQPDKCRLVFIMHYKHGIIKTHNLTYQECESLQAVYVKDLCPNSITAQSKVLQDTVGNFPNTCEEITLSVCPSNVKITNYVDDEPDPSKVMHTVTTLVPEEFDYFQIGIDTKVTFCLKELRAILSFSEYVNQPISLHFEQAGKPIVFSFDSDELYQGDFVMATLSESDVTVMSQSSQQSTEFASEKENVQIKTVSQNKADKSNKMSSENSRMADRKKENTKRSDDANIEKSNGTKKNTSSTIIHQTNILNNQSKITSHQKKVDKHPSKVDSQMSTVPVRTHTPTTAVNSAVISNPSISQNHIISDANMADDFFSESFPFNRDLFNSHSDEVVPSPRHEPSKSSQQQHKNSNSSQHKKLNSSVLRRTSSANPDPMNTAMCDENDDIVGNSPPPAKKKNILFGSSNVNIYKSPSKSKSVMLVADTDDEDDD